MKLGLLIAAVGALSLSAVATASAGLRSRRRRWGWNSAQPDFPNYLSPPGPVSCDWTHNAYFHACPTPPEAPAEAAPAPAKPKGKKS